MHPRRRLSRAALLPLWAALAFLATPLAACGDDGGDGGGGDDIADRLAAIDGMRVAEVTDDIPEANRRPGYRYFELHYQQPADHDAAGGATFEQYITLSHRDVTAPMVLHTHGYANGRQFRLTEPASLLSANQITVEHRFFGQSRPEPADWSKLTLEQEAKDLHAIVEALKPIYGASWISTGASKNGETSLFHRRFFPDDVDGTVAYVAPLMTSLYDARFATILDQFGEPGCREALRTFQRTALEHHAAMEERAAAQPDALYTTVGVARAAETAIVEAEWAFWQYNGYMECDSVPPATASDDDLFAFLDRVSPVDTYVDEGVLAFEPYYYQVLDQLGYGELNYQHLADLMQFDYEDLTPFLPTAPTPDYSADAVRDVLDWIARDGDRLLLVYGEWDPWTAARVDLGAAQDSFSFTAASIGHWASIGRLAVADRSKALERLSAWSGVTAMFPSVREADRPDPEQLRRERPLRPR